MEYLESVYREGDGPSLGKDGGPTAGEPFIGGENTQKSSPIQSRVCSTKNSAAPSEAKFSVPGSAPQNEQQAYVYSCFNTTIQSVEVLIGLRGQKPLRKLFYPVEISSSSHSREEFTENNKAPPLRGGIARKQIVGVSGFLFFFRSVDPCDLYLVVVL